MNSSRNSVSPIEGDSGHTLAVDDLDLARAQEYALLSCLFRAPPSAGLLQELCALSGDDTLVGEAHAGLARAAQSISVTAVADEYFRLFVGLGRGELLPYASFYMTGFLHSRPLARIRSDLALIGLRRAEDEIEPEDHLSILCEVMSGLASGLFPVADRGRGFFERHLAPWSGRFFADLEGSSAGAFYRAAGALGRTFMEIEAEAFKLDQLENGRSSIVRDETLSSAIPRGHHV